MLWISYVLHELFLLLLSSGYKLFLMYVCMWCVFWIYIYTIKCLL